jgi:hypothetical protein
MSSLSHDCTTNIDGKDQFDVTKNALKGNNKLVGGLLDTGN